MGTWCTISVLHSAWSLRQLRSIKSIIALVSRCFLWDKVKAKLFSWKLKTALPTSKKCACLHSPARCCEKYVITNMPMTFLQWPLTFLPLSLLLFLASADESHLPLSALILRLSDVTQCILWDPASKADWNQPTIGSVSQTGPVCSWPVVFWWWRCCFWCHSMLVALWVIGVEELASNAASLWSLSA